MTLFAQTIGRYRLWLYAGSLLALAALLALSPSEATLGSVVKIVYLHGALERVAAWAFVAAGLAGAAQLLAKRTALAPWVQALCETAMAFWLAHFVVSIPAQIMAWGGINWREPRVMDAIWITGISGVIYVIALWIAKPHWWAISGIASAATLIIVLNGAVNILHPLSPILTSESVAIKLFYGGIVLAALVFALTMLNDLARHNTSGSPASAPGSAAVRL
ncbi:MAG: hypothetical protein HZB53_13660 [Chloroflexi bacterium]|nr:hypothetical protein [Chloroflexota bacterium]